MRALVGMAALLALAWGLSENRRAIPWRVVIGGLLLQAGLAVLLIYLPTARRAVQALNEAVSALERATDAGTGFVFGYLGGGALPFAETHPGASFILAFKILPLVLVISALGALMFHWGVLQAVTKAFGWLLQRSLGIGGALSLGAATHIFVGMVEAPLLIRPWLHRLQRGELFAMMACGLAGIAGTVMVIYAGMLGPVIPNALGNILIASVISTPAALAIAALMVPFGPSTADGDIVLPHKPTGSLDALVRGTLDGIPIMTGITAVLLVTVAIVTLVNMALGLLPSWDAAPLTLQHIVALPFRPVMYLIGIPWDEAGVAAELMGSKTVLNEFVAYLGLAQTAPEALSPQSRLILTYALCGFANFGSLGIMIGGMGAMVPERRAEITGLGLRAILAGTMATCSSGALAGMLA